MYTRTGPHNFLIVGQNLVTRAMKLRGSVVIDEKIKNMDFKVKDDQKKFEVNETITISVSTSAGSNIIYSGKWFCFEELVFLSFSSIRIDINLVEILQAKSFARSRSFDQYIAKSRERTILLV